MDEKGFLLGIALKVKVICRRGRKNPRYSQDGNREMVTVIECVSAAGKVLPPMYIYKGSVHLMGWHVGVEAKEEATFAWSPKGWTDRELGLEWVARNFEKYTADM
jgi:hypothetical protein